ncbi:uncharacterized protein BYT42DRAFT_569744 [Radiomyces spectabilis]|uniref:uncharacterized protein n=1 Tax=Radiomyces spectabilis TaxID=64574 RepID=UPI002220850D|nr:uncharacterized protein BYT42DRAFT_569744 [Radiomyces spectabilis]KAI8379715.1 hypothetical protein BYT42DRAFT_569744 [Radiomyces spectabilis]
MQLHPFSPFLFSFGFLSFFFILSLYSSSMASLDDIRQQQKVDAKLGLTGLATQLGINCAMSFGVLMAFNILRPNNSLVYAPKYKYSSKSKQPPAIGTGFFAWFKPVMKTEDDVLLDKLGFDVVLFIRFMRMLRRLLYSMTAIGVFVLIPLNVLATSFTGEWPPYQGLDFLSISTINYYDGKFHSDGNLKWYWVHALATWVFSLLIYRSLWTNYRDYVELRRRYFESNEYQQSTHARTLMVTNVPAALQSDQALARWVDTLGLKYPPQQVLIGRRNHELAKCVEQHDAAVRKLEILLSNHLKDGTVIMGKRPMIRVKRGEPKVDAIEYYSERVETLSEKINNIRSHIASSKATNYGWISYSHVSWAHANAKQLASRSSVFGTDSRIRIELAPQPKDIVWNNLSLNEYARKMKQLVATIVFYGFVFLWFIPSSFLSASSNVKDFIRLFPDSDTFLENHHTFVSLMSSWFTPIVMAIFFLILPKMLRLLSQQQGYTTETSLDRQVLAKLYIFFIINNLLVFTVSSTLLSMYSQIHKAVQGKQELTAQEFFSTMGDNLTQIAKNLSDVSEFWVNYVSLKGLGVIMELAQLFALLSVTLRKLFTRPSPRQLQEFTRPTAFDYPLYYNVLIFFFTVGLVYSVIAPLVLPFTLMYLLLATMVFRYLLMYVFVTKIESGGQIWRLLINRLLASTLLYQIVMIGILNLKGARVPSVITVPLPILTLLFKWYCRRRFDPQVYYYMPSVENHVSSVDPSRKWNESKHAAGLRFGDPAFFAELPIPMIHERVRHLIPRLYGARRHHTTAKTVQSNITRQKSVRHLSVLEGKNGHAIQFQSIAETELELDDSTEGVQGLYKFEDNPPCVTPSTPISSLAVKKKNNKPENKYSDDQPLMGNEDEEEEEEGQEDDAFQDQRSVLQHPSMQSSANASTILQSPDNFYHNRDMEYFVAGRSYRWHDPLTLDRPDVIEMAHLYRERTPGMTPSCPPPPPATSPNTQLSSLRRPSNYRW